MAMINQSCIFVNIESIITQYCITKWVNQYAKSLNLLFNILLWYNAMILHNEHIDKSLFFESKNHYCSNIDSILPRQSFVHIVGSSLTQYWQTMCQWKFNVGMLSQCWPNTTLLPGYLEGNSSSTTLQFHHVYRW